MPPEQIDRIGEQFREIHLRLDALYREQFTSNKELNEKIEAVAKQNEEQMDTIRPIAEAYTTIKNGSVWIKYAFWFVGAISSVLLALRQLFKND